MVLENNIIPYSLKMIVDALGTCSKDQSIFIAVAPALWVGGSAWVGMLIILRLQNWWQGYLVFIFNVSFVIMTQIWYLCHAMADFFRETGVARKAIALLSVPIEIKNIPGAKPLVVKERRIEFENVAFHYNKGKKVFENKSVIINPKERIGLVGFSGSGKTTFIHLILRFFNVESGKILIDGQDISQVSQESLRTAISMIPQDTALFHHTLMENIRYGDLEATDEEVLCASKLACCDEFISLLPEG